MTPALHMLTGFLFALALIAVWFWGKIGREKVFRTDRRLKNGGFVRFIQRMRTDQPGIWITYEVSHDGKHTTTGGRHILKQEKALETVCEMYDEIEEKTGLKLDKNSLHLRQMRI